MKSIYVVSDVYGCYFTLRKLLKTIPSGHEVYFTGNLIDHGKHSRMVVDYISDNYGCANVCLGNHEQMMIESLDSFEYCNNEKSFKILVTNEPKSHMLTNRWFNHGGERTLDSYGYGGGRSFNSGAFYRHVEWFKALPLYISLYMCRSPENRYMVVSHSSISSVWGWSNDRKKAQCEAFKNQILWNYRRHVPSVPGVYNVFANTPTYDGPTITPHYANIENLVCNNKPGYGYLVALKFPELTYTKMPVDHKDL